VPWESIRVADLMLGFLEHWEREGLTDESLSFWLARFREDKRAAARELWSAIRKGIEAAFADGPAAIRDVLSPGQSGKLTPPGQK